MKYVVFSAALVKEGLRLKLIHRDKGGELWYGGAKVVTYKPLSSLKHVDVGEFERRLNRRAR